MKIGCALVRKQTEREQERLAQMTETDQPEVRRQIQKRRIGRAGVKPVGVAKIPQREADAAPASRGHFPGEMQERLVNAKRSGKPGSVFGYKAHVGVDQGSGLIRAVVTTPANVNDTTPADRLIRGDETVVLADAAYHTHARQAALEAAGIKPRLARRANKHHPLSPRLRRYNRLIARQRAAVETTFATLKQRMKLRLIRYRGLLKASAQITLCAMAFNLRRWAAITA